MDLDKRCRTDFFSDGIRVQFGTDMEKSNLGIRVERIEKVLDGIRRDVGGIAELNTGVASMKTSMEALN